MAFFRPHVFSPYATHHHQQAEPSFHGLFRLLEDWDNHKSTTVQSQQPVKRPCQRVARRQQSTFTPRFDVQETESAYELHGELPGVQKKDINIEFSDPQTLVIRGLFERSSTITQDTKGNLLSSASCTTSEAGDDEDEGVLVSHGEDTAPKNINADTHSETSSQRSFKATVEDDTEDQDAASSASASAVEKDTNVAHNQQQQQQRQQRDANENGTTASAASAGSSDAAQPQNQTPSAKFWISERSYGTFSRTFEFPERIEIDNVSAELENGVLSLRVPKAKKFGARQISVL